MYLMFIYAQEEKRVGGRGRHHKGETHEKKGWRARELRAEIVRVAHDFASRPQKILLQPLPQPEGSCAYK
jgi:hypothetical protein